MATSFIERVLLTALSAVGFGIAAAYLYFRADDIGLWYAMQLSGATVALIVAYMAWYRAYKPSDVKRPKQAVPVQVSHEKADKKIPLQVNREKLAQLREQTKGRRSVLGMTAIVLLLTASTGLARAVDHVLVLAVGTATATFCWFHFDHRADDEVAKDTKEAEAVKPDGEAKPEKAAKKSELDKDDPQLDLLRLEYTKGAERYENIYKAIWQNFSYLSVVSAGILTFGGARLSRPVLSLLAVTPICFWYLATFLPMDYYGQEVRSTLRDVQDKINYLLESDLLHHFGRFARYRYHWRVRDPVRAVGTVFVYLWLVALAFSVGHLWRSQFTNDNTPSVVAGVKADIQDLRSKRDATDSTIRVRLDSAVMLLEHAKAMTAESSQAHARSAFPGATPTTRSPASVGQAVTKPPAITDTTHGPR